MAKPHHIVKLNNESLENGKVCLKELASNGYINQDPSLQSFLKSSLSFSGSWVFITT